MERFSYVRAGSVDEAMALLGEPGVHSRPLAGGTDLLLLLRAEPHTCDRVVDITQIPELRRITRQGDRVTIGAGATFSQVIENPIVQETAPVLVQACQQVGAPQIRNMGTLGGNVANAAACADSLPALICLDATVQALTPDGPRQWPVTELVRGPNRTILPPGGLIVSLSFQVPLPGSRSAFLKLGRRNALAISRLTVAALGRLDGPAGPQAQIVEARLVPGSATPHICRFTTVEERLAGQTPSRELMRQAAQWTAEEMTRMTGRRWSSEFKEPAIVAMTERALSQVFGVEPDGRAL